VSTAGKTAGRIVATAETTAAIAADRQNQYHANQLQR
jgi:hypothetical protein